MVEIRVTDFLSTCHLGQMKKLITNTEQLSHTLRQAVEDAWQSNDLPARPETISAQAKVVQAALAALGNEAFQLISSEKIEASKDQLAAFVIHYRWAGQAKAFLILWRDVIFEMQKALILKADGVVSEQSLNKLDVESKHALSTAAQELMVNFELELAAAKTHRWGPGKLIAQWQLQKNPWPVYEKQLAEVMKQCDDLVKNYQILAAAAGTFDKIRQHVTAFLDARQEEIKKTESLDAKVSAIIEEYREQPGKIAAAIEDLEEQIEMKQHLNQFSAAVEASCELLPAKAQACIGISGGMLEVSDVLVKKRTRQWLEAEIIPVLYEVWELTESAVNGMKMALINIRNRASLMAGESKEVKTANLPLIDLNQPLRFFTVNLKKTQEELRLNTRLATSRLEEFFRLSDIFHRGGDFLPVTLQSTIQQFSLDQNKLTKLAKNWFVERTQFFRNLQRSVKREEALSLSEKVARYINARAGDASNAHYANIFITKGYIGESFAVGRTGELAHFGKLVENWQAGFRGAVCTTGKRFAGKSLFGELVANRFFPGKTIRLSPNEDVRVQGRKMEASFDLEKCLEFVKKYSLNTHPLVWIDDLEFWSDPEIPLAQNVRMLVKFMDDHADDIFFMVSMSNWLKAHLDTFLDFDKAFQAKINLDRMRPDEIRKAILIRHGATHKKLVNENMETLTPQAFNKITAALHRVTEGNIGEALSRWSCSTWMLDDEHVVNRFSPKYSLPDFLNTELAMVLSSVMLQKRANEYRLRKLFGPVFSERYVNAVQRLVNTGILNRQPDSWLEVNELVANEVGRLLESKGNLKDNER